MTSLILYGFSAGAVATVNPCGFALVPAWFAREIAAHGEQPLTVRFVRSIPNHHRVREARVLRHVPLKTARHGDHPNLQMCVRALLIPPRSAKVRTVQGARAVPCQPTGQISEIRGCCNATPPKRATSTSRRPVVRPPVRASVRSIRRPTRCWTPSCRFAGPRAVPNERLHRNPKGQPDRSNPLLAQAPVYPNIPGEGCSRASHRQSAQTVPSMLDTFQPDLITLQLSKVAAGRMTPVTRPR